MRYWTSDLHFEHRNIVNWTDRPVSADEHTAWLIDLWNSQVNRNDIVYHLGDFSFDHNFDRLADLLRRLNGEKYMVYGNHDNESMFRDLKRFGLIASCDYILRTSLDKKLSVEMCHYPWVSWRNQARGSYHLHGHCHGSLRPQEGRILDAGLDNAFKLMGKHAFFTEQDLRDLLGNIEIYTNDHHKVITKE